MKRESWNKKKLCIRGVTPPESSWEEPLKSETEINVSADQKFDKLQDELPQTEAAAARADFREVFVKQRVKT